LEVFQASKTWALAFTKLHALRSAALHGEAADVDARKVAAGIAEVKQRLQDFTADCIYNVDETGLFYKLLPRRPYTTATEARRTVRGTKGMSAKDRVTAYVCTNAGGSHKVPMALIGKALNPRCFRLGQPHALYMSQKNVWSDSATFKRWCEEVFVCHVRRAASRPVALVVDNFGAHTADIRDPRGQIHVLALPPSCTAVH